MKNSLTNVRLLGLFSALLLCIGVVQAEKQLILGPMTISSAYNGSTQKYFPQIDPGKMSKLTVIIDNLPDNIEGRKLNEFTDTPVVLYFSLSDPSTGSVYSYKRCGGYAHSIDNDRGIITYFDPSSEDVIKNEMGQYYIQYTPNSARVVLTPFDASKLLPGDARKKGLTDSELASYNVFESRLDSDSMKWMVPKKPSEQKQPGDKPKDKPKPGECAIS